MGRSQFEINLNFMGFAGRAGIKRRKPQFYLLKEENLNKSIWRQKKLKCFGMQRICLHKNSFNSVIEMEVPFLEFKMRPARNFRLIVTNLMSV